MKEVLLHIGMHKTGTTSIQSSLRDYDDGRTRYARFTNINHSIPIITIFSKDRDNYHIWKRIGLTPAQIEKKRRAFLEDLTRDCSDESRERLVISGEGISRLEGDEREELLNFFHGYGLKVKVICFVRSPGGFIPSVFQQGIKQGAKTVHPIDLSYRRVLSTFADLLSKEDIKVVDFAKVMEAHGDSTLGFASIAGLTNVKSQRENEALSASAAKLIFRLNQLPLETLGSRQKVAARRSVMTALSEAYPVGDDADKLDKGIFQKLVKPKIAGEIAYLKENFAITFDAPARKTDVAAVESYLNDLSSIDTRPMRALLEGHGITCHDTDDIDGMLRAFFQSFR
ncbi:hypothetical protein [Pseudophaeobacter sp.]|jgi:hypothetical protein|uniref:hypothetical protein n=1 Tax=Pseudophaeobacter sp. TaxID=1971739 RepID=UPI0025CBAC30|nr:hypothetical protein [uncultured Pseudophaeobacter sp.]